MNDFIEFRIQREPDLQTWGVSEKKTEDGRIRVTPGLPRSAKALVRAEIINRLDKWLSLH